ncbi:MAG: DUF4317 domain-containing protein [Oscillospiraceae bacterium]|nr:DUF4317 domain-containing protein [Oscillospiraceae bacterium]
MNSKEIAELRRSLSPEKNSVSRIYGCFVNSVREVVADLSESLGMIPQEDAEKYLSLLKKTLSGSINNNLFNIDFSAQQVLEGDEHRLLMSLRKAELKDNELRHELYSRITSGLDMEGNYLILLAHNTYDVPRRRADNGDAGGSDEAFSFVVCAICPVKDSKAELGYCPSNNKFHCSGGQIVATPQLGFLFPAFDDRTANIHSALYYSKSKDELHPELVDALFRTEPLKTVTKQREAFHSVLCEAMDGKCGMELMQAVHEEFAGRIEQHKESGEFELLVFTPKQLGTILQSCGVSEECSETFSERCAEEFGEKAELDPVALIDTEHFAIKTSCASITVPPELSYLVETRTIDGKKYILIPADSEIELNGLPVSLIEDKA